MTVELEVEDDCEGGEGGGEVSDGGGGKGGDGIGAVAGCVEDDVKSVNPLPEVAVA